LVTPRFRLGAHRLFAWACALFFLATLGNTLAAEIRDDWQDIDRVIAIGDIHGDYDNYIATLRDAGVIDRRGRWAAGKTHVVQVGDIPDRGPDTLKIIKHLQKLEKQATKAGGHLHVLIGNHEYMNIVGDLRYVHPGEYDAFRTRGSKKIQDNYYAFVVKTMKERYEAQRAEGLEVAEPVFDDAFKNQWYEDFPLGYVEHRLAWQAGGEIFGWVTHHNTVIRINNTLFLHGGLSTALLPRSISEINARIRAELRRQTSEAPPLGESDTGPLWYRGLARAPETTEKENLEKVLRHFGAERVVLGHTPDLNVITPRFGGAVVIVDTGISAYYGGHRASLLLEDGVATARHGEHTQALPVDDAGMVPYFEAIATLKPENSKLPQHLAGLMAAERMREITEEAGSNNPTTLPLTEAPHDAPNDTEISHE